MLLRVVSSHVFVDGFVVDEAVHEVVGVVGQSVQLQQRLHCLLHHLAHARLAQVAPHELGRDRGTYMDWKF